MNGNNIEHKLKNLNLEIPSPIVILPDNLNLAHSKDDLNYSSGQLKAILYLQKQNVNAGLDIKDNPVHFNFILGSDIATIVLTIFIQHADPITTGIISNFLSDLIKGKLFNKDDKIKLKILKKPNETQTEYEGPVSGLKPIIEIVNSDPLSQIKKLGELKESGLITVEEFESKKTELLKKV